jgi:hypothetical protein
MKLVEEARIELDGGENPNRARARDFGPHRVVGQPVPATSVLPVSPREFPGLRPGRGDMQETRGGSRRLCLVAAGI